MYHFCSYLTLQCDKRSCRRLVEWNKWTKCRWTAVASPCYLSIPMVSDKELIFSYLYPLLFVYTLTISCRVRLWLKAKKGLKNRMMPSLSQRLTNQKGIIFKAIIHMVAFNLVILPAMSKNFIIAAFSLGKSWTNCSCHLPLGDEMLNRLCNGDIAFVYTTSKSESWERK